MYSDLIISYNHNPPFARISFPLYILYYRRPSGQIRPILWTHWTKQHRAPGPQRRSLHSTNDLPLPRHSHNLFRLWKLIIDVELYVPYYDPIMTLIMALWTALSYHCFHQYKFLSYNHHIFILTCHYHPPYSHPTIFFVCESGWDSTNLVWAEAAPDGNHSPQIG